MAVVSKALFRGSAATTSTTLYTTPAGSTAVVTNIAVTNASTTSATFTLLLDDIELQKDSTIEPNTTAYIDLKQVLAAAKTIKGSASVTTVDFHISGVEIV